MVDLEAPHHEDEDDGGGHEDQGREEDEKVSELEGEQNFVGNAGSMQRGDLNGAGEAETNEAHDH